MITQPIYILDAVRTPIGSIFKGLKNFSASDLAAIALKGLLERNLFLKNKIDQVILGTTVSAGTGQNLTRKAIIDAGLSLSTPGFTINCVCGSGLQSVIIAANTIIAEGLDFVIAGGAESASQCPQITEQLSSNSVDSLVHDGLICHISKKHMGELADQLAAKYSISRQEQDIFSVSSHEKAISAQNQGKFKNEIIPVALPKGNILDFDEKPRKNINLEKMAKLPSAFLEQGTITAGNASAPADGASVIFLCSEKAVKKYGLKPKAVILGHALAFADPSLCFEAGLQAAKECIARSNLKMQDIDLFEIGESFAAQAIFTYSKLGVSLEKVNVYGGDIALGHPLGSMAARALTTLLSGLWQENKKRGLITVCFGSGGGVSLIVEKQ